MTDSFWIILAQHIIYGTSCEKACPQGLRPSTLKPVLSGHSKKTKNGFQGQLAYRLMQVKSIAE